MQNNLTFGDLKQLMEKLWNSDNLKGEQKCFMSSDLSYGKKKSLQITQLWKFSTQSYAFCTDCATKSFVFSDIEHYLDNTTSPFTRHQSNSFILETQFKSLLQNMMKSSLISRLPIHELLPDGFIFVFESNQNNYVKQNIKQQLIHGHWKYNICNGFILCQLTITILLCLLQTIHFSESHKGTGCRSLQVTQPNFPQANFCIPTTSSKLKAITGTSLTSFSPE